MTKISAKVRFENARNKLSEALNNLEKTTQKKLREGTVETKVFNLSKNDVESFEAKLIQQSQIIENLNLEINQLQKSLSDLGAESEFLHERNKNLAEKLSQNHILQADLIKAVELDLAGIEELIKEEDGDDF
jgi:exonuclease VII small subunit